LPKTTVFRLHFYRR